jgi:hypothetical protein
MNETTSYCSIILTWRNPLRWTYAFSKRSTSTWDWCSGKRSQWFKRLVQPPLFKFLALSHLLHSLFGWSQTLLIHRCVIKSTHVSRRNGAHLKLCFAAQWWDSSSRKHIYSTGIQHVELIIDDPRAINLYQSNYHVYVVVFYPHGVVVGWLVIWNAVVNSMVIAEEAVVLPKIWKQLDTAVN